MREIKTLMEMLNDDVAGGNPLHTAISLYSDKAECLQMFPRIEDLQERTFYDYILTNIYGGSRYIKPVRLKFSNVDVQNLTFQIVSNAIFHNKEIVELLKVKDLEYNPIWNVDGTETTTYSKTKDVTSYSEEKDVITYSNEFEKLTNGQQKKTNVFGATDATTTEKRADVKTTDVENPYEIKEENSHVVKPQSKDRITYNTSMDDETFYAREKVTETNSSDMETIDTNIKSTEFDIQKTSTVSQLGGNGDTIRVEENTHTDTETSDEFINRIEKDSHNTTENKDAHTTTNEGDEHSVTLERHGNIGVTSTQNLMQQQIDVFANNPFFVMAIHILCDDLFLPIFESEGCDFYYGHYDWQE